jgi:hypothetical protein
LIYLPFDCGRPYFYPQFQLTLRWLVPPRALRPDLHSAVAREWFSARKSSPPGQCCHMDNSTRIVHRPSHRAIWRLSNRRVIAGCYAFLPVALPPPRA